MILIHAGRFVLCTYIYNVRVYERRARRPMTTRWRKLPADLACSFDFSPKFVHNILLIILCSVSRLRGCVVYWCDRNRAYTRTIFFHISFSHPRRNTLPYSKHRNTIYISVIRIILYLHKAAKLE